MREWMIVTGLILSLAGSRGFTPEDVARFDRAKVGDRLPVSRQVSCNICSEEYVKISDTEVQQIGTGMGCTTLMCGSFNQPEKFK